MTTKTKQNKLLTKPTLLLFLAIFMGIGTYFVVNSRAAVGSTYYVSSSGNDSSNCSQASPCLTFDKAYRTASAGDTVYVIGGTYNTQTMTSPAKDAGNNIIFEPAPGANVLLGSLIVEDPSYITFRNFTFSGRNTSLKVTNSNTSGGSSHIIFENLSNLGKIYAEGLVSDITFRNIEAGDVVDNQSQIKKYDQSYPTSTSPTRILIENSTFHDYRVSSPSVHSECLQIINSVDVTVRNSKLYNCSGTAALGVTNGPHINLKVENNWLVIGTGQAYYSAQITKNITNLIFRNNSSPNAVIFSDSDAGGPYSFTGNYMAYNNSICGAGINTDFNVFNGGKCGTNDLQVSSLKFSNIANNDFHLASNSEAIDRGNPSNFPLDDIDKEARPSGNLPDAGADEFRSGTSPNPSPKHPGDVNSNNVVDIDDLSLLLINWKKNYPQADFVKDNIIDIDDLSILLINWGKKGTTTPPPPTATCTSNQHEPGGLDSMGGCWPGPNNTGVPSGTVLSAYTGPKIISIPNTVIDSKKVTSGLDIRAPGVVIRNSKISGVGAGEDIIAIDTSRTSASVTIEDSEIDAGQGPYTGIGDINWIAKRVKIFNGHRGAHCYDNCTLEDSYIADQWAAIDGSTHESGARMGQRATFKHNTLWCNARDYPPDGGCSADLTGYGDFTTVHDNRIEANLFMATTGGYCAYGGSSKGSTNNPKPYPNAYNIIFINNIFKRSSNTENNKVACGYYGTISDFNTSAPGNQWTNNKYDNGVTVSP